MTAAAVSQREEWIGVRAAAKLIGTSTYGVQKYALAKLIRFRTTGLLKIMYHRDDVERIAELGGVPPDATPNVCGDSSP
jgi:hypothetical protein